MKAHQRLKLTTPDSGTIYCDTHPWSPAERPWHLVTTGRYFATPSEAQTWINAHWNDPPSIEDRSYARAESSFGEQP